MFITSLNSAKEIIRNWASVKEISELFCCDHVAILVVDHGPGLQLFDTVAITRSGRGGSSSSVSFAGDFFNGIEWHLLGKAVSGSLAIGLIDEEVVDVLGCGNIFDVF